MDNHIWRIIINMLINDMYSDSKHDYKTLKNVRLVCKNFLDLIHNQLPIRGITTYMWSDQYRFLRQYTYFAIHDIPKKLEYYDFYYKIGPRTQTLTWHTYNSFIPELICAEKQLEFFGIEDFDESENDVWMLECKPDELDNKLTNATKSITGSDNLWEYMEYNSEIPDIVD